jgi:hypothetical protein
MVQELDPAQNTEQLAGWFRDGLRVRCELRCNAEDGGDELSLGHRIALGDPATFADCMHRFEAFDPSACTLHRADSKACRMRFLMNRVLLDDVIEIR